MGVDVETELVIERPVSVVCEYAANPENAPEWYTNIDSAEWKTSPTLDVGSRVTFVAHFLGKRLSYTYEIAQWQPGEVLVMRTSEGPFPMETTYRWEETLEGHTLMKLRNRGKPSGFSRIAAPLMAKAMKRANEKDLIALRQVVLSRA